MPSAPPSRWRGLSLILTIVLAVLALAAAACGGGNSKETGQTPPAGGTPGAPATTVDVTQKDNLFEPDKITARTGQGITIKVTNKGINTHNLHIAGPDGQFDTEDDAVIQPVGEGEIKPGQSASLEWTAPDQPGTIKFRCDFHPTQMTGTINVGS